MYQYTAALTIAHADATSNGTAADDCTCSTEAMSNNSTAGHPPVVGTGSHCDCSDLAAITPFAEEGHYEGLYPCWAEKQGEEVVETAHCAIERGTAW